jgi:alcohol dehydrogenase
MEKIEFNSPTRIHYGAGALGCLGDLARGLGGHKILLVSDPGIVSSGHVDHAAGVLRKSDLAVVTFHDFEENPTEAMAERGSVVAREEGVDLLIGMGGGSSMDCAKAINFLATNGGRMRDYWGYGKAQKPMLPMIAVPTTAGTGSEVQSYALIAQDDGHRKMACGDPGAAFRDAILDPQLTLTLPAQVTAATGFDAIGHAVETYVTTRRNPLSEFFSLEAWRLLEKNFERVLQQPGDIEARAQMLLGSCFAGVAIENSMLGATHALANPLTERHGTTHGIAIAILLCPVVTWNSPVVCDLYKDLAAECGGEEGSDLELRLKALLQSSGLPRKLREIGIKRDDLPDLARDALQQWTGTFNPRPLTEEDALALYESAY